MCRLLHIPRSSLYFRRNNPIKSRIDDSDITDSVKSIFKESRCNYGSRKIKAELNSNGVQASLRRIRRVMRCEQLVSKYSLKNYKITHTKVNEDKINNELDRKFNTQERMETIVSDLTYVKVGQSWQYICLILDLFNREIVGYSAGPNKDANLVKAAFDSINYDLKKIELFHTDRGHEFKNEIIEAILKENNIKRSLSAKGCPFDNAVAESTYKIIKTEFTYQKEFRDTQELQLDLFDYVNWYNNHRIHSTLGYLTPVQFRQ